jgi:DNA-binding NarL/FixJ family response regulator
MKVLIVEDNPKMRRMIADFIADKFEEIYECADGDEAFALYKEHHPDWVLMDWNMPKKDGITATREIVAEFTAAQICMVTTFDSEELRQEAKAAGAGGFVLKRNLFELETVLVSEIEN